MFRFSSGVQSKAIFALDFDQLTTTTVDGRIERDVKILRVGTFRDMTGKVKTYTLEDLEKAAQNFRQLRSTNILPNVPVKVDHSISMKDVGGYFLDVRVEAPFLIADIEFTSAKMAEDYRAGHLRNRSVEIGEYVTNEGQRYDPVVVGLAFVDLPAVEGLYRLSEGEPNMSGNATSTQTPPVTTPPTTDPTATGGADPAKPASDPPPATPPATDPPATDPPATDPPATDPPATTPPATEPVSQHQRPGVQSFRLYGQDVSDYAKVQAHITDLEQFRAKTIATERDDFITKLATDRVITNPMAVQFKELVKSFSVEQFAAFKASYVGATPPALFDRHDLNGSGDGNGNPATITEIEEQEEIIANLRRSGKDDAFIKTTAAFRKLTELRAAK